MSESKQLRKIIDSMSTDSLAVYDDKPTDSVVAARLARLIDRAKADADRVPREVQHAADQPSEPITTEALAALGWTNESRDENWPIWKSPPSQPAGGPVCHIEWQPYGGCDGWAINGESEIGPFETMDEVIALCRVLKIPTKASE